MFGAILSLGNFSGFAAVSAGRMAMTLGMLATAGSTVALTFSGAVFSDTQALASNSFSAGTVQISTTPTSAAIALADMAPGSTVTGPLTVSNSGSLQHRYAMTSATTEDTLAAQLDMTVKSGVTTCTTAGFGVDGTVLYGPADLGSASEIAIVGDVAQGAQAGDRTLAASASEVLCVQVSLPLSTGNTFQSLSTAATFNFTAEQTDNNS
jgi:spore coat-associated protein N